MESGNERVHHPIVARLWDRMSKQAEERGQGGHRDELLRGLAGRVLEIGAGNGINFAHYPASVTEVLALEPESHLRERALAAAEGAPVPVRVIDGVAGRIPAEDASFDAAVACLVLCTVPDQAQALEELRRVLKPGGELRVYEHVVARRPAVARLMRAADRVFWTRFAGGDHMSRDTGAAIARAGFVIESCRRFPYTPTRLQPAVPHILGVARRPASSSEDA
jgi:ubiquinone/menaquinone biosynthesis C-methylase UbiE